MNRLRYKIFTSFALAVLGVIAIARLWAVAPPSGQTAAAYATAAILVIAAVWRGIILLRASQTRVS
jgi:hypothetical protein